MNTGSGYTEKVLYSFSGGSDGAYPVSGLIADANGDLFGTTNAGGSQNAGTVFELVKTGSGYTEKVLCSFGNGSDGASPDAGLITDAKGDLFGTTVITGPFELVNTGSGYTEKVIYSFSGGSDGGHPNAGLITDANGDLFGTTFIGGAPSGGGAGTGTVFELVKTGSGYTEKVLYSFSGGSDGAFPDARLITDANGDLFGTTINGGANGYGTVFELVNTGSGYTEKVLYSFSGGSDGAIPLAGLFADAKGDLFGTTANGGYGPGTVFEITNSGFVVSQPLPPIVMPDLAHAIFGTTINVAAAGVLANDTPSVTGDTLTVSAVDGLSQNVGGMVAGAYGTLTLNADGSYAYNASGHSALPSSGVSEDFFGYTALEGGPSGGGSASSTLTVVVTAPGLTYVAAPAGGSATQPNGGHYAVLDGTAGNATLNAANGVGAALVGGNGDTLNGANSGKDTFVFMGDFGTNTVNNYIGKANGNFDVIQLSKSDYDWRRSAAEAASYLYGGIDLDAL